MSKIADTGETGIVVIVEEEVRVTRELLLLLSPKKTDLPAYFFSKQFLTPPAFPTALIRTPSLTIF